jgi:pimeloyl-ACP methyl ester carboxylesterase
LPHARLLVFPGAGHMIPLERPEELTREIVDLTRLIARDTAA